MKYQPTIHLTDSLISALHAGAITIQCGQWVQIPWLDSPSRWVGRTKGGSIWAVHTHEHRMDGGIRRFTAMCNSLKKRS